MSNKTAIVTGAGSGIGRLTSIGLAKAGWRVVLAGLEPEWLAEARAATGLADDRVLVVPVDITDADGVAVLFDRTVARFGRVDLLFNNAGIFGGTKPLDEITPQQWRTVIDVNLTGAFLCTQAAFRAMKAQTPRGGRIINNGSVSAQSPRPQAIGYTASKNAITGLTKATALEGRAWNIACGQIDLGNAATDMTHAMETGMLQADGSVRPEPRMDVRHAVEAILYMASLPLDANVPFMTLMATAMPLLGRG
jgi:NAD(P)-dependent dehydrogenase (short-subunit alcohol dehydrogenase family)